MSNTPEKTCDKCKWARYGNVRLCPKHAAVEELVEALTDCQVAVCEEYCGPHIHVNACENAKALLERIAK